MPAWLQSHKPLAVVVVALFLGHLVRFQQDDAPLLLGWMAHDFAYRLVWMVTATCVVFWMTRHVWPETSDIDD